MAFQVFGADPTPSPTPGPGSYPYAGPNADTSGDPLILRVSGDETSGLAELGVLQSKGVTIVGEGNMFNLDRMLPGETAYGTITLYNSATFPVLIKVKVLDLQNGVQTTDFIDKLDIVVSLDKTVLKYFPAKGMDVSGSDGNCTCPDTNSPDNFYVPSTDGDMTGCDCYPISPEVAGSDPTVYTDLGWLKAGATAQVDVTIHMQGRATPGFSWDETATGQTTYNIGNNGLQASNNGGSNSVLTWVGPDGQTVTYGAQTYQEEAAWLQWWFCVEEMSSTPTPEPTPPTPPTPQPTTPQPTTPQPTTPPGPTVPPPGPTTPAPSPSESGYIPVGPVESPTETAPGSTSQPPETTGATETPEVSPTPTEPQELENKNPPEVPNVPEMPTTGEVSLWPRMLAGVLVVLFGLFLIAKRPRKKGENDKTSVPRT
jgi:hypothetical protein